MKLQQTVRDLSQILGISIEDITKTIATLNLQPDQREALQKMTIPDPLIIGKIEKRFQLRWEQSTGSQFLETDLPVKVVQAINFLNVRYESTFEKHRSLYDERPVYGFTSNPSDDAIAELWVDDEGNVSCGSLIAALAWKEKIKEQESIPISPN